MKKSYLHSQLIVITVGLMLSALVLGLVFPPYFSIESSKSSGNFSSDELFLIFTDDPPGAFFNLGNKIVVLEGAVAETGNGYVLLGKDMQLVKCQMRRTIYDRKYHFSIGENVVLKGVCRGLNLTELLLTNCVLIKARPSGTKLQPADE